MKIASKEYVDQQVAGAIVSAGASPQLMDLEYTRPPMYGPDPAFPLAPALPVGASAVDYNDDNNWFYLPSSLDRAQDLFVLYPSMVFNVNKPELINVDDPEMATNFRSWSKFNFLQELMDSGYNLFIPKYIQFNPPKLNPVPIDVAGLIAAARTSNAWKSVQDAFAVYINKYNSYGRPYSIYSHSQGSVMAYLLIQHFIKTLPAQFGMLKYWLNFGLGLTEAQRAETGLDWYDATAGITSHCILGWDLMLEQERVAGVPKINWGDDSTVVHHDPATLEPIRSAGTQNTIPSADRQYLCYYNYNLASKASFPAVSRQDTPKGVHIPVPVGLIASDYMTADQIASEGIIPLAHRYDMSLYIDRILAFLRVGFDVRKPVSRVFNTWMTPDAVFTPSSGGAAATLPVGSRFYNEKLNYSGTPSVGDIIIDDANAIGVVASITATLVSCYIPFHPYIPRVLSSAGKTLYPGYKMNSQGTQVAEVVFSEMGGGTGGIKTLIAGPAASDATFVAGQETAEVRVFDDIGTGAIPAKISTDADYTDIESVILDPTKLTSEWIFIEADAAGGTLEPLAAGAYLKVALDQIGDILNAGGLEPFFTDVTIEALIDHFNENITNNFVMRIDDTDPSLSVPAATHCYFTPSPDGKSADFLFNFFWQAGWKGTDMNACAFSIKGTMNILDPADPQVPVWRLEIPEITFTKNAGLLSPYAGVSGDRIFQYDLGYFTKLIMSFIVQEIYSTCTFTPAVYSAIKALFSVKGSITLHNPKSGEDSPVSVMGGISTFDRIGEERPVIMVGLIKERYEIVPATLRVIWDTPNNKLSIRVDAENVTVDPIEAVKVLT